MRVQVEVLDLKMDARGWVVEPLDPARMSGQGNVHVVMSAPGCVRGNHYHRLGTEIVVVLGPALLRIRDGSLHDFPIPPQEAWRFTVPPGVSHAIQNTGQEPSCLVAFNTIPHDPACPDVVTDVLIVPPDPAPSSGGLRA